MFIFVQSIDISEHLTSSNQVKSIRKNLSLMFKRDDYPQEFYYLLQEERLTQHCLWNGVRRPCYLFARKFLPDTLENLLNIFSNFSTI